jgi:hypothetical protein
MLPLLQSQESKLLIPAPFFQPQWSDRQAPHHCTAAPAPGPFSTDD